MARVASCFLAVLGISLVPFACTSSGGDGEGGAAGDECRGPLEDYCSPCPTYEQAFTAAFQGFQLCSGDGPPSTLPSAGTCGELRWIVTWDVVDEYFEYFDATGAMVGAIFVTDVNTLCAGSFSKRYGWVPDCERVTTTRACEPQQDTGVRPDPG